ncbi:MAG: phosphoribosylanthranilate isomerase [Terrimicrobiaceae bacterium]
MSLRAPHGVFVKICGLTSPEDAGLAVGLGADAIGINFFAGSKRYVPLAEAEPWLKTLTGRVQKVAVVVNPGEAEVKALRESQVFDAIQFHGDESPAFCQDCGFDLWIKAVRVRDRSSLETALTYSSPYLLLDAWSETGWGGTGVRLDWGMVRSFVDDHPEKKVILAGGLTPNNLADALRIVAPFGVDVASGVEVEPRRKEEYLLREFLKTARSESHTGGN